MNGGVSKIMRRANATKLDKRFYNTLSHIERGRLSRVYHANDKLAYPTIGFLLSAAVTPGVGYARNITVS